MFVNSALNLFCVGGIPNLLCLVLYNVCRDWFIPTNERLNKHSNSASISSLEDYVSAHVYKYFLVLFGVALSGVIINLLPSVQKYVQSIEDAATESIKTPILNTPLAQRRQERKRSNKNDHVNKVPYDRRLSDDNSMTAIDDTDEEASSLEASPLLRIQRHKAYMKYGSGPKLYKSGSMRAGLSADERNNNRKLLNKHQIGRLYRNTSNNKHGKSKYVTSSGLAMTPEGGSPSG